MQNNSSYLPQILASSLIVIASVLLLLNSNSSFPTFLHAIFLTLSGILVLIALIVVIRIYRVRSK